MWAAAGHSAAVPVIQHVEEGVVQRRPHDDRKGQYRHQGDTVPRGHTKYSRVKRRRYYQATKLERDSLQNAFVQGSQRHQSLR